MAPPRVNIIVAMSTNGAIGRDGDLPWHISADLKRFKSITMGHPIVMGRKTFESIGRPLPGRTNIVITRQLDYQHAALDGSCLVAESLQAAVVANESAGELMVIGGAEIYAQALAMCERIFLTEVHAEIDGDVFFPVFERDEWLETAREDVIDDMQTPFDYSFVVLERPTATK